MITKPKYNNGYDSVAKILVLGDSGVGKTCLTLRFCEDNFIPQYYTTIGTYLFILLNTLTPSFMIIKASILE